MAVCYAEYRGRTTRGYIQYVNAKIAEKQRKESYRTYVTDALYAITNRKVLNKRWVDLIQNNINSTDISLTDAETIVEEISRNTGIPIIGG